MEASPPRLTTAQRLPDERKELPSICVAELKPEDSEDSGLVDHLGRPLYRKPKARRPIGFGHAYEESA